MTKLKKLSPILVLFFLAPAVGELLSGSAPPAEFFSPFPLLFMCGLYGSGAILIRELRLRWNKGWPTVLLLGAAYGIVEEGLTCKSFFNPEWGDLGILGVYGRWVGVNWVWTLFLTIYHALISITIPILLTELLFPDRRHEPWLGRCGTIVFGVLMAAVVIFGFLAFPYHPPLPHVALTVVVVIALYRFARRLPAGFSHPQPLRLKRPGWLTVLGFAFPLALYLTNMALPQMDVPVILTLFANPLLVLFFGSVVLHTSQHCSFGDKHRFALAAGVLLFFVMLAPLQELDSTRADDVSGMTIVGLAALAFLIWAWRKVRTSAFASNRDALPNIASSSQS